MKEAALFLFNHSNVMPQPWHDAGVECHLVDIAFTDEELAIDDGMIRHRVDMLNDYWLPPLRNYIFVAAFVPCTDVAVSGARWFKSKGPTALARALTMFARAQQIIEWTGAPGFIENPVSNFSSHCGKPQHTFHPYQYTAFEAEDNYTKKTCLWTWNNYKHPAPEQDLSLGEPDKKRIHYQSPGPQRNAIRSKTPAGFARAVFAANYSKVTADTEF